MEIGDFKVGDRLEWIGAWACYENCPLNGVVTHVNLGGMTVEWEEHVCPSGQFCPRSIVTFTAGDVSIPFRRKSPPIEASARPPAKAKEVDLSDWRAWASQGRAPDECACGGGTKIAMCEYHRHQPTPQPGGGVEGRIYTVWGTDRFKPVT